jgi:hypothetical protein
MALTLLFSARVAFAQATVPFVGCPSDGQVGPLAPPHGQPLKLHIAPEAASQLAFYKAEDGPGVLAPRGWHCFSTYGSNGSSLFVTPQPLTSNLLFSDGFKGFDGPAIQLSQMVGDTSGRFSVAETIARLFPAHRDFAKRVLAEHSLLKSLPKGPYPTDKLHYLKPERVEYTTPANIEGEGTESRLLKSSLPISGVALLTGEELSCTKLAVRLPAALASLAPTITHTVEAQNPRNEQN